MAAKTTYFVPNGHEEQLRAAELSFTPAIAETADRDGPPFRLPGFVITSPESKAKKTLKELELEDFIECRVDNRIHRLATGAHGESVALTDNTYRTLFDDDGGAWSEDYLTNATTDLSSWINRPIDLHIASGRPIPPTSKSDRLLVVLNGRPPGEPVETKIGKVCGIDLGALSYTTYYTAGVGELVRDRDTVIGQIVGNTFYVFLEVNAGTLFLLGMRGANIRLYERMLALVWNQYLEAAPVPPSVESSSDELRDAVATWEMKGLEKAEADIIASQEAMREAEATYRNALASYMASIVVRDGFQAMPERRVEYLGNADMQSRAWDELRAHSAVVSIRVVEGGINLTTRPLTLTYEGTRYRLGSFVLRLNIISDLFVWCTDSPHPKRVPHPHVSEDGDMCYGNLALTIERVAIIERNFPKVFRLALELLTEGYDPKTTLTPITEWPEEKPDDGLNEPLPSSAPLRPADGSDGHVDRSRVGG